MATIGEEVTANPTYTNVIDDTQNYVLDGIYTQGEIVQYGDNIYLIGASNPDFLIYSILDTYDDTQVVNTATNVAASTVLEDDKSIKYNSIYGYRILKNKRICVLNRYYYSSAKDERVTYTINAANGSILGTFEIYSGSWGANGTIDFFNNSGQFDDILFITIPESYSSEGNINAESIVTLSGDSWIGLTSAPIGIYNQAACVVGTDIYYFGGQTSQSYYVDYLYKYDTVNDIWSLVDQHGGGNDVPRRRTNASMCSNGTELFLLGGEGDDNPATEQVWKFTIATNTWSRLWYYRIMAGQYNLGLTILGDYLYVLGYDGHKFKKYDINTGDPTDLSNPPDTDMESYAGRVFLSNYNSDTQIVAAHGQMKSYGQAFTCVYKYDVLADTWDIVYQILNLTSSVAAETDYVACRGTIGFDGDLVYFLSGVYNDYRMFTVDVTDGSKQYAISHGKRQLYASLINVNNVLFVANGKGDDSSFLSMNWKYDTSVTDNLRYGAINPVNKGILLSNGLDILTYIGKVNQYKPFDDANITPAVFTSPMEYIVTSSDEFNAFTLAKVLASSITYSFIWDATDEDEYEKWNNGVYTANGTGGNGITKMATVDIDCKRDAVGRFSLYPTTVIYYAGIQMPSNSTIEITLTHTDDIELGDFTVNNTMTGGFTNMDFSHTIKDFNDYTPDAWGNVPQGNKAVVTKFNVTVDILLENYDHVVSLHESLIRKFITIDASDSITGAVDSKSIFASLIRRVRIVSVSHSTNVKGDDLGKMATVTLGVQEIV